MIPPNAESYTKDGSEWDLRLYIWIGEQKSLPSLNACAQRRRLLFASSFFFHFRKKQPLISPVSPEQSFPSPLVLWKPGLHLQWKDPLVLAHMELLPQASDRHSLISVSNKETILLASLFNICLMRRPRVGSPYKSSSLLDHWINCQIYIYIVDEEFNYWALSSWWGFQPIFGLYIYIYIYNIM